MDHPNVVKLIDVFEDEKHWCLVMDLMQGGELFDIILEKVNATNGYLQHKRLYLIM